MGRRADTTADETRRRVLEAAVGLFGERGVGRTSVREVGRAAGVTLATVHHHFGTKAELHRACVDAMYGELRALEAELEPLLARALDPAEAVAEAIVAAFRFARRHRAANRLVVREVLDAGGELPERVRQAYLLPFLARGSALLAGATGLPRAEARLVLQSMTYLVARYALNSDRELLAVTFADPEGRTLEEALGAIERHLVRSAEAQLGLRPEREVSS